MTPQTEIATKLLRKFPKAKTHTLSRMAYKANPKVFLTHEAARSCFRRLRGASGQKQLKHLCDTRFVRPIQKPRDPFARIPEGQIQFKEQWGPVVLAGASNNLLLCDIHFPFHCRAALMAAMDETKRRKITRIILNGDIGDFFAISDFMRDPRLRNFKNEIDSIREFLTALRAAFPHAEIVFKLGNHEERWERYLTVKAPELLGIEDFELSEVLQFKNHGIQLVDDKRPIRLGKLNIIHGHEYKSAFADPVNPARTYFQRAKVHCIGGDKHRTSQHSENSLDGTVISTWSIGCLCDLRPKYQPLNNWNHGFAFVEVEKDGNFFVDNLKIIDGKIY